MPARSKVGSRKRTAPRRAVKAASGPHAASASRKTRGTSKKKTAKPSPAAGRKTGKPSPAAGPRARAGREAPWRQEFQRFRREWRRTHPPRPGKRHEMARTFLKVTRTADTASAFSGLGLKHVPVIVQNLGNVAAYTCVVRMLEARPRSPIHEKIPLGEFTLGQLVFTLQPGERTTVRVPFMRTRANGTFIAIVSDPLLDPNELTVADFNHRRLLLANLT